jgi:hypothetical protein
MTEISPADYLREEDGPALSKKNDDRDDERRTRGTAEGFGSNCIKRLGRGRVISLFHEHIDARSNSLTVPRELARLVFAGTSPGVLFIKRIADKNGVCPESPPDGAPQEVIQCREV